MNKSDKMLEIYEYEKKLCGNGDKKYSYVFAPGLSEEVKKKQFIAIWKYLIENILEYTPYDALNYFDKSVLQQYSLLSTLSEVGIDINSIGEQTAIKKALNLCYPSIIKFSYNKEVVDTYKRVCNIDEYRFAPKKKWPKNFFIGPEGIDRAKIIMKYCLKEKFEHVSKKGRYFKDCSENGPDALLKETCLIEVAKLSGFSSVLELYKESTGQAYEG